MKILAVLAILSASLALSSAGNVACYMAGWAIYRWTDGSFGAANVDPTLCTHIIWAFVGLNADGTLRYPDDWSPTGQGEVASLVALKEDNPDLKIMISLGGYAEGSESFSLVVADEMLRATLVENLVAFLTDNMLDGLDVDWEYPGQGDGSDPENDPANYVSLLTELKAAFTEPGYILSAAVSAEVTTIDASYPDAMALSTNLDMINVMTFDFHGSWETVVGHNAPLYASSLDETDEAQLLNVAAGVQHWLDIGADPAKINFGIGFYGRSFTLADRADSGLYAAASGAGDPGPLSQEAGLLGYNEICALYGHWPEFWDEEQMVPHKVNGDQWVGYDDAMSIQGKMEWAMSLGLGGGAFVWSIDTDDFHGYCGDPFPLLRAINNSTMS